jgi:MoaA/NifB/PqqE/SkfB family radical SAM enzyme
MRKIMINEITQKIPIRNDAIIKAPAVTFDSFSAATLGKNIFILSGNLEGVGLAKRLKALNFKIGGFIDSRFQDDVYGFPLVANNLTNFLKSNQIKESILIISTKDRVWKKSSFMEAELAGYVRGVNLFTPLDLCPYFPTIEIAGKCNLVCKTCDMGLPSANKGRGYMSAQTFEENLKKLLDEIPFLNSIALYTWGEPLMNPQVAEIIRISNRYGVSTEVSTNLDYHKYLDDFVLAEPSQIVAPCAGIGERYERGRTGGSWNNYLSGLKRISKLKQENNLNISLRIMYHIYNDNYQQDLDEITSIAKDLGFTVIPILAHIFPGQVLKYALTGVDVPKVMREAEVNLIYGIDEQLSFAKSKVSLPCHIIQAFPTISWDGRVLHCCNMQRPYVTSKLFTEAPLSEFIRDRNDSAFCTKCMNEGVHRFFDVNIKFEETPTGRKIVRL